jgi:hypothetical protein
MNCKRKQLIPFLANKLDVEDKLEFLFHLEDCSGCWDAVYNSIKARHPHYYKTTTPRKKVSKQKVGNVKKGETLEVA